METMTSNTMNRVAAEKVIWNACDELFRSAVLGHHALDVVLEVLLWARWIPSSEGKFIGYFDAMRSLTNTDEWNSILEAIAERSGAPLLSHTGMGRLAPQNQERLRSTLLPIGRALNSGDPLECKAVIEAMAALKAEERHGPGWGSSSSMELLWQELLSYSPMQEVACLFPFGVSAAPGLGMDHPLLLAFANLELKAWILGLLSLYKEPVIVKSVADHLNWSLAIAAPPWGEKGRDLLENDPWLPPIPLDCPAVIRDAEARRVYGAHQRCTGTTYALMSPGIGFRTSRDLEYFREELVRKNWLHSVVALPSGAHSGTRIEGLLLVLKHDRVDAEPVQMVMASELLMANKGKSSKQIWEPAGIRELAGILHERRATSDSRLVTVEEIAANGFSLQVGRYFHSESDLALKRYLGSRQTEQLGDLAEIRRPVASLGRQEDDGIEVREVTPGDIDDSGRMRQGSKVIRIAEIAMAKGSQNLLEIGDVLLSIKGGLGRVAIVQDLEHPTVPGQAFCVIRLRPNARLTPVALVQYLRSAVGQTLLNRAGQGATVAFVPMGEVKSLPIVIPGASELKRVEALEEESVNLSREVEELSLRLQQLSRQGWFKDIPPTLLAGTGGEGA